MQKRGGDARVGLADGGDARRPVLAQAADEHLLLQCPTVGERGRRRPRLYGASAAGPVIREPTPEVRGTPLPRTRVNRRHFDARSFLQWRHFKGKKRSS